MDGTTARHLSFLRSLWLVLLFLTLPAAAWAGDSPLPVFGRNWPGAVDWSPATGDSSLSFQSHWDNDLNLKANLSVSDFNDWAGGGTDATTWFVGANGTFKRRGPDRHWTTRLVLDYGEVKTGEEAARKNMDKIFIESVLQLASNSLLSPFLALSAQSQFTRGYDYSQPSQRAVSGFSDPLILTQTGGLGYEINSGVETRLGAAMRETFTRNFPLHSDDPSTSEMEKRRTEGGFNSITTVNTKINGTLVVRSRLEMFLGFNSLDKLNVDWDNEVSIKAWGALGVNYRFQLRYNDDIFAGVQTRQVLGVGLNLDMI